MAREAPRLATISGLGVPLRCNPLDDNFLPINERGLLVGDAGGRRDPATDVAPGPGT